NWDFHKKVLNSAKKAHKLAKSATFHNIHDGRVDRVKSEAGLTVENIALTLIPTVFIEYEQLCQQYKEWEKLKCSEGIVLWRNVVEVEKELNLIKDYIQAEKSQKLIKTLQYLSSVPTQIERLQQLSTVVIMFKVIHSKEDW